MDSVPYKDFILYAIVDSVPYKDFFLYAIVDSVPYDHFPYATPVWLRAL